MSDRQIEQGLRFERMLNLLGLSMYTDEWACKVLAVAYWLDGKNEAVVLNPAFHFAIRCSQQKLKITEERSPDPELVRQLMDYIKELKQDKEQTDWLKEVSERYGFELS